MDGDQAPAPEAEPKERLLLLGGLWLVRAALLALAVACFVLPDFQPGQLTMAWSFYGCGVFVLGVLLLTFRNFGLSVALVGAYVAVTAFGLFALLEPDRAAEWDSFFQDTSRYGEVSDSGIFFGGVISLVVANGLLLVFLGGHVLEWLGLRLGRRPRRRVRRNSRGRHAEESLFPPGS